MLHAYNALKNAASKTHSVRLAQLAASIRMEKSGHFDAVIASINEIIQMLKDEEAADIKKRDECKEKYQTITSNVNDLSWKISVNDANIDKLEKQIANREEEKMHTIAQIEDVSTQIAAMEEQRISDNQAFLNAKSDDTAAIELLMSARDAISKYYKDNGIAVQFIEKKPTFAVSEDQAPDFEFDSTNSRSGESKGVVSLITMLIEDLNDEVKNGLKSEEDAQLEFEKMLKTAKNLKQKLEDKVVNLDGIIAKRGEEKIDEDELKTSNSEDKQAELSYEQEIKPDCDWIIGSFSDRSLKRSAEMDGLLTAKQYLAGAKPSAALLEQPFDDARLSNIRFLGFH